MSTIPANPAEPAVIGILRRSARAALQWRVLLLWVLAVLIPTVLTAVPIWRFLASQLDHTVQAAEWARHPDLVMFVDLIGEIRPAVVALAGGGAASLLLFLILMPFLNSMMVGAARTRGVLGLGELLHAGFKDYGPMLRLAILSVLPLGLAMGVGGGLSQAVAHYGEHAIEESQVDHASWAMLAVFGLVFSFASATVDAGRARLAYDPFRRSAIKAWWRGLRLLLAQPLRGLGLYLGIMIPSILLAALLGELRIRIPGASTGGFLAGALVVQLIAALFGWTHFARLIAMLELTRAREDALRFPVRTEEP